LISSSWMFKVFLRYISPARLMLADDLDSWSSSTFGFYLLSYLVTFLSNCLRLIKFITIINPRRAAKIPPNRATPVTMDSGNSTCLVICKGHEKLR
jgi:hypothetical protein